MSIFRRNARPADAPRSAVDQLRAISARAHSIGAVKAHVTAILRRAAELAELGLRTVRVSTGAEVRDLVVGELRAQGFRVEPEHVTCPSCKERIDVGLLEISWEP